MTEIQEKLLNILRAFDTICRKYDAEYFLTGGSALGAIRHNGFIPWDDDIDLGMTRPMWEKIRPHLETELPDGLVMVDYRNHETYRNPIAKIIDTNSAVLYRASLADECPKGQYIEIFTHDPVPEAALTEHRKNFLTYCELMTPYFSVFHEKMNYKRGLTDEELSLIDEYYKAKERAEKEGRDKVLAELEDRISKYRYDESDYLLLEWGVNACYYPLENFGDFAEEGKVEVRYEKLEDMMVPVAKRACDNLRIDYGNSWTDYPPKAAQVAHVTVGDENISGAEFMKVIEKQISPEKTRAMRLSQKEVNIKALPDKVERNKEIFAIQMKAAQFRERLTPNLGSMYEAGEYGEIAERFKEYILLKKRLKNYTFTEDLTDNARDIIAISLVMLGRISDAENVLNMPRNLRISGRNSATVNDILRLTKANSCYYDKFPEEARELMAAVDGNLRDSLTAWKVTARLDIEDGKPAADFEEMMQKYPGDMDVVKLAADTLALQGRGDEAEKLYDRVLAESNNGMDILDIETKRKRADR